MLRFKVDENLPLELVALLRASGADACHVLDQQLGGQADRVVAEVCKVEARALITLDLDFCDLRTYPPGEHAGIVVLRMRKQDPDSILDVFRKLLPSVTFEKLHGRLWVVDESGARVRSELE